MNLPAENIVKHTNRERSKTNPNQAQDHHKRVLEEVVLDLRVDLILDHIPDGRNRVQNPRGQSNDVKDHRNKRPLIENSDQEAFLPELSLILFVLEV